MAECRVPVYEWFIVIFWLFSLCMALCSSTEKECQNCAAVCYKVSHLCKLKADLQPAHSLFLASLLALHSYLFFPFIKADHPSVSAASAMSLAMHCFQWFDAEIDLSSHFLNVNWHDNILLTPLSRPGSTLHAWGEQGWFFFSSHCSHRIPKELLYQTGMIRQRQSCLESHQSEVQELPIVSLNPCINSKGTAATAQVRRLEMQALVQLQGDFLSLLNFC